MTAAEQMPFDFDGSMEEDEEEEAIFPTPVVAVELPQEVISFDVSRPFLKRQQGLLDGLATMLEEINEQWANALEQQGKPSGTKTSANPAILTKSDVLRLESVSRRLDRRFRPVRPFCEGMAGDIALSNVWGAMEGVMANLDTSGMDREQDVITATHRAVGDGVGIAA